MSDESEGETAEAAVSSVLYDDDCCGCLIVPCLAIILVCVAWKAMMWVLF